jgi:ABC-type ATPase involved in cell division
MLYFLPFDKSFYFIIVLLVTKNMYVSELTDYAIAASNGDRNLNLFHFTISRGDVCCIRTDSLDDAHMFLRALATLVAPEKGIYRFRGRKLDFSDYREILFAKKQIGFIAPETAMLSNRTIRQNLLFMRSYFENSLSITLDDDTFQLCKMFGLVDKLDLRPAALDPIDLRIAITIRELIKPIELLILERPEFFVGQNNFSLFTEVFQTFFRANIPVVFFSEDTSFQRRFSTREIIINEKRITTVDSRER